MEFSIRMAYRKVTLKVNVEKPECNMANLEQLARKQNLTDRVAQDIRNNQDRFFLLK